MNTPPLEHPEIPDSEPDIETLLDRAESDYERRRAHHKATELVQVGVPINGPIGIAVIGDPHLDSIHCNIGAVRRLVRLIVETEGVYASDLGDDTDNWTGRLGELYAHSNTSRTRAKMLAEWFFDSLRSRWLVRLRGNHDLWSALDDEVSQSFKKAGALQADWSQRVELVFPNGCRYRINHKHGFNGHSMWNRAHGQLREMALGDRDHLYTGGHTHQVGIAGPKADHTDPQSPFWMWGVQVGTFKDLSDGFGKRVGNQKDVAHGPAALIVIDPEAPDDKPEKRTHIFYDVEMGCRFLTFLRTDWRARYGHD